MRLGKVYEPNQYEDSVYELWKKSGVFVPKNRGSDDNFSIVVPPPNANGDLHLGHGLTLVLEDIVIRYHRMKGEATLLLPGADHAGFETQVVYEKLLAKDGKSRFDFSREELYNQIWDFVAQNRENYLLQFRKLGASVDWSRYVYTLDKKIVNQAYDTFKKMWEDGLIYRGERLVNFCTHHGTAFADIEVEYKEEKGKLWHIKYPLTDGSGEIIVATTRPETMLGDTAVAVHPNDKRYAKMIGKTVKLPLTKREIPILADDMVDMKFGSGAVKITPAHDPNDYDVAQRHDLPMIRIIGHEGTITHEAGEDYVNLPVKDARKQIVQDLKNQNLLAKTEDHTHSVGHCYKCGTIIEPLLREQWFVDMQPLATKAIQVLESGTIKFHPETKRTQLIRYLKGLRDWNISRQIAWGIPIPAFQNVDNPADWIFDARVDQEYLKIDNKTYHRDPDVFDTWFSSSSWPYATLNYPDGADFARFYPLNLMETGADILYPWVSRMIMFGLYTTGQIPFKTVYLHGLIQDEHGAKMSKSKGNVIAPMAKIEEYGSDAFRMGIIATETAGNNRPFDPSKLVGARNFCNKLWNMARYVEGIVDVKAEHATGSTPKAHTIADHWVLSKLQQSIKKISGDLDNYRFAEAYDTLYHLVWNDVADWYIEAGKSNPDPAMLSYILHTLLALAHPFAPFVTETIWQTLHQGSDDILAVSSWPKPPRADTSKAAAFEEIINCVTEVRYLTQILEQQRPRLHYHNEPILAEQADVIRHLAKTGDIVEGQPEQGVRLTDTRFTAWLGVPSKAVVSYQNALQDKLTKQQNHIKNLASRLKNKSYVANAPTQLVQETKTQLKDAENHLAAIQTELKRFQ